MGVSPTALLHALLKAFRKLDQFLNTPLDYERVRDPDLVISRRRFLDGDQMTLADCNLLPKLNIVNVRSPPRAAEPPSSPPQGVPPAALGTLFCRALPGAEFPPRLLWEHLTYSRKGGPPLHPTLHGAIIIPKRSTNKIWYPRNLNLPVWVHLENKVSGIKGRLALPPSAPGGADFGFPPFSCRLRASTTARRASPESCGASGATWSALLRPRNSSTPARTPRRSSRPTTAWSGSPNSLLRPPAKVGVWLALAGSPLAPLPSLSEPPLVEESRAGPDE